MIPVAIGAGEGADFRAPLGRAVIGGVITSTLLTLLVIPTFYEILTDGATGWARSCLAVPAAGRRPAPRASARRHETSARGRSGTRRQGVAERPRALKHEVPEGPRHKA